MNVIAPASGAPSLAAKPTTQSPRPGARSGLASDFPETVERVSATTRAGRLGRFDNGRFDQRDDEVRLEQRSDKTSSNPEAEIEQSPIDEIVLPADSFSSSLVQQAPIAKLAGRPASLTPQPPRTPVAAYARAANLQSPIAPTRGTFIDTTI